MNAKQKMKAKTQIKNYQEKIKELREKLKARGVTDEGGVFKLNNAVLKGGKDVKMLVEGGLKAKGNRGKKPDVVKTYTNAPQLAPLQF